MDFKQAYNRQDFLNFLQGQLLPDDFVPQEEKININRKFSKIKKVVKLGKVSSLGSFSNYPLFVYEVEHDSENDPRITLTREIFSVMRDMLNDRALVIFKTNKSDNYRFSLVKIELKSEGKRVKKDFSNPRRYSFYLGPDAKINTPTKFLIKEQQKIKDFEDLINRFSLEPVNKEFFNHISIYFNQLVGGKFKQKNKEKKYEKLLILPSVDEKNHQIYQEFAVRLIGRIIFVWFLKHKKSENNVSLVSEELLSSKAVSKNSNYYHNILEKLFFEILNTPIEQRKKDILKNAKQVPFLNGGLFDPHEYDFYNGEPLYSLTIPDEWFKGFFEILEQYNFTIDENTSADIELSVDPEMLGRIFENLLAEINPETGETARKSTGSYYTPRPIVEYMVDESIKKYIIDNTNLKEDIVSDLLSYSSDEVELSEEQKDKVIDALDNLKIIDPACGSGAFPMGILQKSLLILQKVDPKSKKWFKKQLDQIENDFYRKEMEKKLKNENWDYVHKLGIIQNSIYGVDIQPIAVEISKLRFFLSLVVEEKIDDENPDNRGIKPLPNLEFKFVCANSLINLPTSENSQSSLFEEKNEIDQLKKIIDKYFVSAGNEKESIKFEFTKIQKRMFENQLNKGFKGELTRALASWDPFFTKTVEWFDPEWMFGIKEFNIVIGNPPYNAKLSEKEKKYFKTKFKSVSSGRQDTAAIFVEKGNSLLKDGGVLSYILPYRLFSRLRNHGQFQKYTLNNYFLKQILYLGSNIGFTANDEFMILILVKLTEFKDEIQINFKPDLEKRKNIIFKKIPQKTFLDNGEINLNLVKFNKTILNKILENSTPLINICYVKDGIVPFIREKMISKTKKDNRYVKFSGIAGKYKLDKYFFNTEELYLCYDIEEAKKHIKNVEELRKVQLRDKNIFLKNKIITSQNSSTIKGTIDYDKYFVSNSIHSTYLKEAKENQYDLKYILSLLNSKLINYYHNSIRVKGTDLHPQILIGNLKKLPIKNISIEKQKPFIDLVDKILEKKKENPEADISDLEKQIDNMVYKLYDLTDEEIKIIEDSFKK